MLYNQPTPVACEYCGKIRKAMGVLRENEITWYTTLPCQCEQSQKAQEEAEAIRAADEAEEERKRQTAKMKLRIQKIIGESGIGKRFQTRTFDNFEVNKGNSIAYKKAKKYADEFSAMLPSETHQPPEKTGLLIIGSMGTGKTHLAVAIANQVIQTGMPVICMTMIDLLGRIKATYEKPEAHEDDVLRLYKTVPLLVIDDMGKEKPSEWALSQIYTIINSRYEEYMPIVITSNYGMENLIARLSPNDDLTTARATIDRLREMCVGIQMQGESWRGKHG